MIVCSTSVRSIGCTFLDWSIHFLTGQTEFFNIKELHNLLEPDIHPL